MWGVTQAEKDDSIVGAITVDGKFEGDVDILVDTEEQIIKPWR